MGTLHELEESEPDTRGDDRGADVAFVFVLAVLWAFSVARVVAALSAHEVFGAEASLAFLCMLALPGLAFGAVRHSRRRPPPRSSPNRQAAVVVALRRRG